MFRFIVYGRPIVKKNARQIYINKSTNKPFIGKRSVLIEYENDAYIQLLQQKKQYENAGFCHLLPINHQVSVSYTIYLNKKTKADAGNLKEAVQDCLVSVGILKDDNFNIINPEFTQVFYDKNNTPRIEISITNI